MIMRCLSPSPGTPQGRASSGESRSDPHPVSSCMARGARLLADPTHRGPSCFSPQEPGQGMQREGEPASAAQPAP